MHCYWHALYKIAIIDKNVLDLATQAPVFVCLAACDVANGALEFHVMQQRRL